MVEYALPFISLPLEMRFRLLNAAAGPAIVLISLEVKHLVFRTHLSILAGPRSMTQKALPFSSPSAHQLASIGRAQARQKAVLPLAFSLTWLVLVASRVAFVAHLAVQL